VNESAAATPHEFEVRVTVQGTTRVVAPSGELDLATSAELEQAFTVPPEDVADTTVLDFRELTFIDSSGISVLLDAARRADEAGRRIACVPGPPQVQRVFELTGIDQLLDWVDDPSALIDPPPA